MRPDFMKDIVSKIPSGYVLCRCGQILSTREDLYDHYELGHFDKEDSHETYKELFQAKFTEFILSQKDLPQEFVDFVNKNFWELL